MLCVSICKTQFMKCRSHRTYTLNTHNQYGNDKLLVVVRIFSENPSSYLSQRYNRELGAALGFRVQ